MNNRIHLKLFANIFSDSFLGSANISKQAISDNISNFNYEICTHVEDIDRNDRIYLQKIISESTLITDEIYTFFKENITVITPEIINKSLNLLDNSNKNSDYLISKLPMIDNPDLLWGLYSEEKTTESQEQENCLCHDPALYGINKTGIKESDFYKILTKNFFELPFISTFLEVVDNSSNMTRNGEVREGLRFGAVRIWFSENTSTAPTPRPFELTKNVQILYSWIEHLSNGKYSISVLGAHSQVIKNSSV